MPNYRVSFFNDLVNSNGQQFKCLQRSLIIRNAIDEVEASVKAKREFEHVEQVLDWASRAHFVEIEQHRNFTGCDSANAVPGSRRATGPSAREWLGNT